MGLDASSGDQPVLHTSTGEWQSFEQRMRQRRIDRLLVRARLARDEGNEEEARIALEEVAQLGGKAELHGIHGLTPFPLPPPVPQIQTPDVDAAHGEAPVIIVPVPDDDLAAFGTEQMGGAWDVDVVDVDDEVMDVPVGADLPLYPLYLIPSAPPRARWGARIAGLATAGTMLFWFAGPRWSEAPATAVAEMQSQSAAPVPSRLGTRSAASTAASVRDSVSADAASAPPPAADAAPGTVAEDSTPPDATPPVSLAGLELAEPRATSPAPSAAPDAVPAPAVSSPPPPPLTAALEPAAIATVEETIPVASQPALPSSAAPVDFPPPSPAPVASAPPPAPSSALPAAARETAPAEAPAVAAAAGVRSALMRYESAYSRLDADAARAVWPALDGKALARAFDGLASQEVSLGACEVRIAGEMAIAECAGSATWTPKVGGRSHRQSRHWQFRLREVGEAWQIVSATVR